MSADNMWPQDHEKHKMDNKPFLGKLGNTLVKKQKMILLKEKKDTHTHTKSEHSFGYV